MDMQFDLPGDARNADGPQTCARITGPRAIAMPVAALDWPSLSARLAAAHATRLILAQQLNRPHPSSGSFAPELAPGIAACLANAGGEPDSNPSPDVNQKAKSDRKTPSAREQDREGQDPTTVRGLL